MAIETQLQGDGRGATMREAMAPTVKVIYDLLNAFSDLAQQFGHQPEASARGMREIAAEHHEFAGKSTWTEPVRDTYSLGAFSLLAASDGLRSFARLFDDDHAPIYSHLVLARAVVESSVVSAWLSEPDIRVEERVRRGLVERLHSARQQRRIDGMRPKADVLIADFKAVAAAFGWPVQMGKRTEDIAIGGTRRPSIGTGANLLLVGDLDNDLGKTIWNYQSAVIHSSWYALAQAVIQRPDPKPGQMTPVLAGVGTDSRSVYMQVICLVHLYLTATQRRVELMGWETAEWAVARNAADQLRKALLRAVVDSAGKS